MIAIEDSVLYVDGTEVQALPALPFDSTVRVWSVPANYMPNGYYVDVWMDGTSRSEPACAQSEAVYLGEVRLPHDADARTAYEVASGKDRLMDAVTERRWGVETGGLDLPGGVRVATGTEDQNRITTVIANARMAGVEVVDFKAASGWVTLTLSEIEAVASTIALHVQACFSAERAHHEAIALLETPEQINAYDIDVGWPQTETAETT